MLALTKNETQSNKVTFGIGKRLMLAFGTMGILSVLISVIAWNSLSNVTDSQRVLTLESVPAISGVQDLAIKTAKLVAAAPMLMKVQGDNERAERFEEINSIIVSATRELDSLKVVLGNAETIASLANKIDALSSMVGKLNQNVEGRLETVSRLKEVTDKVVSMRGEISQEIEPFASSVMDKLIETSDKWSELLESNNEEIVDTMELETAPMKAVSYHTAVLEFKNGSNHMVGLLAEGAKSENLTNLKEIQQQFMNAVNSMVEPIGALSAESDISSLSLVFTRLMKAGDRGDQNESVFKLKKKELELEMSGDELIRQTQAVSEDLSRSVNQIVLAVKDDIGLTIENNERKAEETLWVLISAAVGVIAISIVIGWLPIARKLLVRL